MRDLRMVCMLLFSILLQCTPKTSESGEFFTIMAEKRKYSQATFEILRSAPRIEVCVGLIGFDPESLEAQKRVYWTVEALQGWHDLMEGNPDWPRQEELPLYVFKIEGECPDSYTSRSPGFQFNYYASAVEKVRHTCAPGRWSGGDFCNPLRTFNTGIAEYRSVFISDINRGETIDDFRQSVETKHEFGHVLGLGDGYERPGNKYIGKMPDSIMHNTDDFTHDDKVGLWVLERFVRTGRRSCAGFEKMGVRETDSSAIYCNSDVGTLNTHTPKVPIYPPESKF